MRGVAHLHPEVFAALARYCERHAGYLDDTIRRFDREVQFYLAYLEHLERFKSAGLRFCYPGVPAESKEVRARDTFDLALVLARPRTRTAVRAKIPRGAVAAGDRRRSRPRGRAAVSPYDFTNVLVALDGSEGSEKALDCALSICVVLGSTADRVAHHAHCPVMVVR